MLGQDQHIILSYNQLYYEAGIEYFLDMQIRKITRGFSRRNIVAVSFFQNCAIHQYS